MRVSTFFPQVDCQSREIQNLRPANLESRDCHKYSYLLIDSLEDGGQSNENDFRGHHGSNGNRYSKQYFGCIRRFLIFAHT